MIGLIDAKYGAKQPYKSTMSICTVVWLDVELDLFSEGFQGFELLLVSYLLLKYNFYIFAIDVSFKIQYMDFYYFMRTDI